MRILHIIGQIGVGGCERQLLELCRRMDRKRFQFAVCYYSPNPDNMVSEFEDAGARLYYVNKFGGISLWRFFQTLRGFIRDFRPDVIHTWQNSPNWWGRLAGLSCGYRRFIASDRTLTQYPWPYRLLEVFLGGRTIRTANTAAVADWLTQTLKIRRDAIRVIHNAVELPPVDRAAARTDVRAELGVLPETPIVLTVGRQTAAKNYPMFYRVARRVARQRPDVVFVSAGHGEEEPHLRDLHRQMGLGRTVRMLGLRHDVARLMAGADVFCLCSRWEGFPNVLVEAMASGLPVVSTAFPGVKEVLEDEGNRLGVLVDIDGDEEMAARIVELLADSTRRDALGRAGRESVQRRFSWPRLVTQMEQLYAGFRAGTGEAEGPTTGPGGI